MQKIRPDKLLKIYNFFFYCIAPILKINLYFRLRSGKEQKVRINERFGISSIKRPKKPLIWIHAASIGEFNSATGLIDYLSKNYKLPIMLTTSTITSYIFSKKIFKDKIIHQYAPIDHDPWIKNFLNHWKPNMVIWMESDLWPNTLRNISERKIDLILLNLRISPASLKRWSLIKSFFNSILTKFNKVYVQNKDDVKKISKLTSKKLLFSGNLKHTALTININKIKLKKIKKLVLSKKVILIASSHPKEELMILNSLKKIIYKENIFIIIVPRHPDRAKNVLEITKKFKLKSKIYSKKNSNIKINCLISNTLGEMPVFYKLSDIVIMGGSFVSMGGHNPIEPAKQNCSIITGPYIFNWESIYKEMSNLKACLICDNINNLEKIILKILKNKSTQLILKNASLKYSKRKNIILEKTISNLKNNLERLKDV